VAREGGSNADDVSLRFVGIARFSIGAHAISSLSLAQNHMGKIWRRRQQHRAWFVGRASFPRYR